MLDFRRELDALAEEAVQSLHPDVRKMLLKDFLLLAMRPPASSPATKTPGKRRVTRSMAAARASAIMMVDQRPESLTGVSNVEGVGSKRETAERGDLLIPPTPRINPLLPETPAAIKRQGGKRTEQAGAPPETPSLMSRVRALGSTITANFDAGPVMNLTMDDGKVLQVNLAEDPSRLSTILTVDALKDVKQRMESYANQVKAFFRKLKFD